METAEPAAAEPAPLPDMADPPAATADPPAPAADPPAPASDAPAATADPPAAAGAGAAEPVKPKKKVVKKVVRKKKTAAKELREATPDPSVSNGSAPAAANCADAPAADGAGAPEPERRPTAAEAAEEVRQQLEQTVQARQTLELAERQCREAAETERPTYSCQPADWSLQAQPGDDQRLKVDRAG